MQTRDFDYFLPPELIAQHPTERRDGARMMLLDKTTGAWRHGHFRDIVDALHAGDCLVLNDSKVMPARLLGVSEKTGSPMELLLLRDLGGDNWECLTKPGRRAKAGARFVFGDADHTLHAEVREVQADGNRVVHFSYSDQFLEVLDALGEMPLPPYITEKLREKSRYQTVYARALGSAAAPTAGLHFTPELLDALRAKGVRVATITLHVGLGTFRPVKAESIEAHHMHSEWYSIPPETAKAIDETKAAGGRVIAVGTTCCRTLESRGQMSEGREQSGQNLSSPLSPLPSAEGWTDIFIYPGYEFRVIDGLLTNFHLPQSTLIMLVSALLGRKETLAAYAEAVREQYRFFSFGDCMFIN
ncbi:MAG: tRNA preQ1(34) S-adenosylmethionine ribosyltransferase-isomerase QueA [Oscillospiraceae bacterium]|jgi:S-adenosylmethionine:tRNA ribosyltransferase-isomerase|nr:tRNA preQ1(34) S-adenosylmethionine ribosyltransferase-isomerase QueA [Oscillospiraceae bacterium]